MKVKLNTSRIKPIDEEEKEVLENIPEYNWEKNVWIFEPVFSSSRIDPFL